jgi:soluble lytic murein transglycosylase-like protein
MLARLPWLADSRSLQVVRAALRRGTRFSHYFFNTLGVVAFVGALTLWLQPRWRTVAAGQLMPLLAAAEQTGPAVGRLLSSGAIQVLVPGTDARASSLPMVPYANVPYAQPVAASTDAMPLLLTADNALDPRGLPSIEPFANMIPDTRVVADARDDRVVLTPDEQDRVASFLSRRYRVAESPMSRLVHASFDTGREVGLDPLLLLSVMAIESGFNPYAESGVGAQGLMQVMSKVHSDKFDYFGGPTAALQPLANIKVGALVLKDCIARGGSLSAGLRLYVGSTTPNSDGGYGAKVLAERMRLRDVSHGRYVPINAPQAPVQASAPITTAKAPVHPVAKVAPPATDAAIEPSDGKSDPLSPRATVPTPVHLAEAS